MRTKTGPVILLVRLGYLEEFKPELFAFEAYNKLT